MSGRRAALRVAVKNARRNKKRTVFLVALIALPVTVAVVAAAWVRAGHISEEERAGSEYGTANAKVEWLTSPELEAWIVETVAAIEPEAETLTYRFAYNSFGPGLSGRITDIDLTDPLAQGILTITEGSAATELGEAVLSEYLAAGLGVGVGDTAVLRVRGEDTELEVVGLTTHPILWRLAEVVVAPAEMDRIEVEFPVDNMMLIAWSDDVALAGEFNQRWEGARYQFYPDDVEWPLPPDLYFVPEEYYAEMSNEELAETQRIMEEGGIDPAWTYVSSLFPNGVAVTLPQVWAESRTERVSWVTSSLAEAPPVIGTAVAAVILAEVAFIAGAAFATGTRRRLREIGLLGANGAASNHVRASVVGEGLVAGLGGGLAGSALALILLLVGRPVLQRFVERRIDEFPLSALDLAGPIMMAVAACAIAAWVPARAASQVSTLTALQGRMPVGAPKRWIIPVALVLAAFGSLLLGVGLMSASDVGSAVAVIGVLLMIGGVALLAGPIVAWVSGHSQRFPVTTRIVLRDSGRQRGRAAAAVAATMVILMAPVALLAAIGSNEASTAIYGLPEERHQLLIQGAYDEDYNVVPYSESDLDAIRAILPEARMAEMQVVDIRVEYPVELAQRKAGSAGEEGGFYINPFRMAVASKELLALFDDPRLDAALERDGMALVGVEERISTISLAGEETLVSEVPVAVPRFTFPRLLVTETTASEWADAPIRPYALFQLDDLIINPFSTPFDEVWAADLQLEMSGTGADLQLGSALVVVLLGTMVVVLIVVATITALSASEADHDLRTIVAVGATNSIRRRYLGLQSGLHTLIGALLAVPLTLLLWKTVAMASGSYRSVGGFGIHDSAELIAPWQGIVVLLTILPLAIALITALSVRSAPTTPPRRAT